MVHHFVRQIVTSRIENKIAGYIPDSCGMLATMYVNDGYRNNAKRQKYEANTTLFIITSKVENKIAGCLLDSRVMLPTMYVNDRYKEHCKSA